MKNNIYVLFLFLWIGFLFHSSCKKENLEPNYNSDLNYGTYIDDRDGNEYRTIKIGDQVWIAEDLRYTGENEKYRKVNVYGHLYNEYKMPMACPPGWHLPSEEEWLELINNLGGPELAGGRLKEQGYENWQSPNTGSSNSSGFTALPAGGYDSNSGGFQRGLSAYFWSSTEHENGGIIFLTLQYNSERIEFIRESPYDRSYPIRCIKDY